MPEKEKGVEKEIKSVEKKLHKMNIWMITSIILVIALAAVLVYPMTGKDVAADNKDVAAKAVKFINENLVAPGASASYVSIEDTGEFFNLTVLYQGKDAQGNVVEPRNISVFLTKDGNDMFLSSPLNISQELPNAQDTTQTQAQAAPEVVKADRPEARAFIMSYCPYGLQFITAYAPVMKFLDGLADMKVNFVNYAMHGEKEIQENTRMYCIQNEQGIKFADYLECFVNSTDSASCIAKANIDQAKLNSCMSATDKLYNITGLYNDKSTWMGNYPFYPIDNDLINQLGLAADGSFGSPTFVLNGVELSVSRTPEAIKQAICDSFTNPPAKCSQQLSSSGAAASGGCET